MALSQRRSTLLALPRSTTSAPVIQQGNDTVTTDEIRFWRQRPPSARWSPISSMSAGAGAVADQRSLYTADRRDRQRSSSALTAWSDGTVRAAWPTAPIPAFHTRVAC